MLEGTLGKKLLYATTKFSNVRACIEASAIIGLTSPLFGIVCSYVGRFKGGTNFFSSLFCSFFSFGERKLTREGHANFTPQFLTKFSWTL